MIRYVLILVSAAAILGLTGVALEHASAARGEQAIEGEIDSVETVATSLYEFDEPGSVGSAPRRIVEIEVPDGRLTRDGIETLRFVPVPGSGLTRVHYRVGERAERTTTVDVPIRHPDDGVVDLSREEGSIRLVLELVTDDRGDRIVTVRQD